MTPLRTLCRAACALLLSSFALAAPSAARANMAAVQRYPAVVGGPHAARATGLRVEREQLSLACSEEQRRPVCAFEARYAVKNPGRAREEVAVAFYGIQAREVTITVDGARASGAPSEEEMRALDEAVVKEGVQRRSPGDGRDEKQAAAELRSRLGRVGFRLAAEPGTAHTIVVTGKVDGGGPEFIPEGYAMPAVNARHLLASSKPRRRVYDISYLIWPIRTWKGDPTIDVQVTYPSSWRLEMGGEAGQPWARRGDGDRTVATRSVKASEQARIDVQIELPVPVFRNGGLLLGIGGTAGTFKGPRGRVGYEVAAPDWLLYSLTADTDFRRRFIVTPLVEAATPAILILPSFGIGAGVPVQIKPDLRPGARIQGDFHFYPLGFVTSVDLYPKVGSNAGFAEISFLAQVGL